MRCAGLILPLLAVVVLCGSAAAEGLMSGYERSPFWGEQVREVRTDTGIRTLINAPATVHTDKPTLVVFYATPNGNTIEQTLGSAMVPDMDWHFDIQHIAAQTRRLRELDTRENIVLACMEADGKSWPSWRQKHQDGSAIIRGLVEQTMKEMPGSSVSAVLTGHSGGGSMIFGFINAADEIPNWVNRIAFLDANYNYSDREAHGDKLLKWLRADQDHHLVVIAYDDREIMLDGKKVVSPTGGTFRASHRMLNRFERDITLSRTTSGDINHYTGLDGRISVLIHRNPQNKILHTVLVGEMNGYLEALTSGTPEHAKWGSFGTPRAYTKWIQPAAVSVDTIPPRPKDAPGGASVMKRVAQAPLAERESAIRAEIERGNLPGFFRQFVPIRVNGTDARGHSHTACYWAAPDYLSVGSDKDFVRVPLTPMTAQPIADAFGCIPTTRKMADDIYSRAAIKLEPRPLTEAREAVDTFIQHNSIIERQMGRKALGQLVAGIKKDVVITNLLLEKRNRVAIYGWHKLDGRPIQPLTTVHKDYYVDYSHGIRLVKRIILVDGNPRDIRDVLADPDLCYLVSDEGPIAHPRY